MTTYRTGNGAAWLDLLASLAGRYRDTQHDAIDTPEHLRGWFHQFGLEPSGRISDADVALVHTTREALHRAAVAGLAGQLPSRADQQLLADALLADQPLSLHTSDGALVLRRPKTVAEALARLVRDALQDLTGPARGHLHACGDDTCSGIFADQTGRRRWCSDQQCGNRMRVAAYRARTRSALPD